MEDIVKMADLLRRPASYNHETRGNAFLRGRLAFPTKKEARLCLTLLGSDVRT